MVLEQFDVLLALRWVGLSNEPMDIEHVQPRRVGFQAASASSRLTNEGVASFAQPGLFWVLFWSVFHAFSKRLAG